MSAALAAAAPEAAAGAASAWRRHLGALAAVAAAILLLFIGDAADIAQIWWNSSTYNHCLLVPPLIAWLVWQRRPELLLLTPRVWLPGLALVGAGAAAWLVGDAGGIGSARHFGLVVMLQGSVVTLLGKAVSRGLLFPLFYAWFMVPFGEEAVPAMQTVTAGISMALLNLAGVPAHLEGVFITTAAGYFEVAEACAGVKFLIAMAALGALVANVCFRSWRRRLVFMAAALIVPILANGLRAFATIYVADSAGVEFASGMDHVIYGGIFFAAVIALILGIAWRFFDRRVGEPWFDVARLQRGPVAADPTPRVWLGAALACAVISAPLLWSAAIAAVGRQEAPAQLHLPDVPGWTRVAASGRVWQPHFAGADHLRIARYRDAEGREVDLAIVLFARQQEGRELIGFGQGAAGPQSGWAWTADAPPPPQGRAERIVSHGEVREVVSFYRVGDILTGSMTGAKLETMKVRLLGGPQRAVAILVSAPETATGTSPRPAIDAFTAALGPLDRLADRAAAGKAALMCGIAGIFHIDVPKPVDPERVGAMADTLAHRGPDGSGVWTAPGVGLGHRRLAIIDLEGGVQPMQSADRRAMISFNGEIYNYLEVREQLEAKGHRFRTAGDVETILAAWREWGVDCLARLNGMFAFAIYDAPTDSLFLARDRLGVKPLFFSELGDGTLLFGSELKALLVHPRFRPEISPQAVEDYLAYGYVPDDASILQGVRKLPAGSYLHLRRGHPLPQPVIWWDVDFSSPSAAKEAALQEELVERLRAAVRSRMVADVPLAAFLSGGVDSSAVVAFMAEASKQAIRTCSIGFDQPDHDETSYAAAIAERFATDHRTRIVAADDYGLIDTLAAAFDEPFADASALATYRVCELARDRVKVALSGDGADEAFAGYRRHRMFMAEEQVRGRLPRGLRSAVGRAGDLYPKLDWAPRYLRAKTSLQAIGKNSGEAYAEAVGATAPAIRSMLYSPDFTRALQGHRAEDRYVRVMAGAPASDALSRAQYADLKIWLPGDILTKVDRTSMAVSLEAREPLLDHRLVEFAASLPPRMRLRGGQGKYLLKKALEGRLPDNILYRPKQGFVTPISAWLRGPLAAEAAAIHQGSALASLGWFDPAAIARLAEDHRRGRADHGRLLWQLLMLERSLRRLTAPREAPTRTEPRQNTIRLAAR